MKNKKLSAINAGTAFVGSTIGIAGSGSEIRGSIL
ncbi:hypothetical protein ES708_06490 [subsurface metagenome]